MESRSISLKYRCEAASVASFIQQLAVGYVARGYWFYVTGWIPVSKDLGSVDKKLIGQYGIALSKWARARRKRRGEASVQYLRLGHFFILLATHGQHIFFEKEAGSIQDVRRKPIRFAGYSISCRGDASRAKVSVRIDPESFRLIRDQFVYFALQKTVEALSRAFRDIPLEPYAPVRQQLFAILRAVNRKRAQAGLEIIPPSAAFLLQRRPVQVFVAADRRDVPGFV